MQGQTLTMLHGDWDFTPSEHWQQVWKENAVAMLERMHFKIDDIIMKPSKGSGKGIHLWIHIRGRKLSESDKNMLQWLICLDDPTRVRINILRTKRGLKQFWSKLFSHARNVKEHPCAKCRLVALLREMEKE